MESDEKFFFYKIPTLQKKYFILLENKIDSQELWEIEVIDVETEKVEKVP